MVSDPASPSFPVKPVHPMPRSKAAPNSLMGTSAAYTQQERRNGRRASNDGGASNGNEAAAAAVTGEGNVGDAKVLRLAEVGLAPSMIVGCWLAVWGGWFWFFSCGGEQIDEKNRSEANPPKSKNKLLAFFFGFFFGCAKTLYAIVHVLRIGVRVRVSIGGQREVDAVLEDCVVVHV